MIINNLAVYEFGERQNPTIIFIHGFPLDYRMWENQINFLKNDYHIIAYDCRGLGQSYVGDGQYTMEAFVNDLFSIINELQLQKPVLCGLSMGGYIAFRAVEKSQDKLSGVIFCDTKPVADDNAAKLKRADAINMINVDGLEKYLEFFIPTTLCEETLKENPEIYKTLFNRAKTQNPTGVKGALFAMLSRTDSVPFLEKIEIPTLFLAGSYDKLTPPDIMKVYADKVKNSEFAIAPKAGHLAPLENPNFVNDVIKGFLDRRIKNL